MIKISPIEYFVINLLSCINLYFTIELLYKVGVNGPVVPCIALGAYPILFFCWIYAYRLLNVVKSPKSNLDAEQWYDYYVSRFGAEPGTEKQLSALASESYAEQFLGDFLDWIFNIKYADWVKSKYLYATIGEALANSDSRNQLRAEYLLHKASKK